MKAISDRFSWRTYVLFILALISVMLLCICVGSVSIPLKDTLTAMWNTLWGLEVPAGISKNIILNVRLPRVLNVALVGAALSLCGAAMQGLLRNPLADGSTLGVSSGAALGAVIALAFGIGVPGVTHGGVMVMAMVFAFLSLVLILSLAYVLDRSLSTNSIILIGVIFSMFASSVINLIISFAEDHIKSITFWTMGSLSGTNFGHVRILVIAVLICGTIILRYARELNAFAIGEDNARNIGINVRRHGRPGLDRTYYDWITLYIFAIIFPCGGFLFNIGRNRKDNYVLRNKKDGRVVILLDQRSAHRSGYILGSAGKTDEEGAFQTSVTETQTEWIGNAVGDDCLLQREKQHFSKEEWTLAVAPGDCALSIHIPRNGDLSPEKLRTAVEAAFCHARTYYKEHDVKAIQCHSWLLNPSLGEIVGPNAKISVFGSLFRRYPVPSNGKSVFNFVFQTSVDPDIKSLPENTSLQKALKAKYLAGGCHYDFGGYILPEAE